MGSELLRQYREAILKAERLKTQTSIKELQLIEKRVDEFLRNNPTQTQASLFSLGER